MKQINWKSIAAYAGIVLLFAIAAAVYFWPSLQGKVIYAGDSINAMAAVQESKAYAEQGGNTFWTGAMFSGMPNYQIGGGKTLSATIMRPMNAITILGPKIAFFVFFFYLLAFFALLRTFGVDKWLSVAGAFAIAMSSYFFVIIAAQHGGKTISITWMIPVVIGFYLTYRKKYWIGALLIMFFVPVGFFRHPQMSYYICMMIGILFFGELAIAAKAKEWKHFAIASAVFFASFAIGMGIGSANIFTNQEYANETMRGGHSDLVKESDAQNKTEGLDLDYATAWSEGVGESLTFLVPNYMGGASGYNLGKDSQLEKDLTKLGVPRRQAQQFCQHAPTYWGEKAFTSGPVYMGAIVIFLFVLALLIVDGPYKWALLVATLFSIMLSWGRNFMWLTELFFDYFPMYNKFRAVESILIVADMWPVDKRFCNDAMFATKKEEQKAFVMLPYEKEILQDTSYYRVLNMSTNTFNEARTGYYLHSIGGYSAAKLRRYQDLIDVHISREMNPLLQVVSLTGGRLENDPQQGAAFPVLNMLNMKYAVVPTQGGQAVQVTNPWAYGPVWLVEEVQTANTPNEEIEALNTIDMKRVAVADKEFAQLLAGENTPSEQDKVEFVEYKPNEMRYKTDLSSERVVVFSEIYYPHGWHLYADGADELPIARVNYMLRAARVPAGVHELKMVFAPESVKKGDMLSVGCMVIFLLTLIAALAMAYRERKKTGEADA